MRHKLSFRSGAVHCFAVCTQGPIHRYPSGTQGLDPLLRHRHRARIPAWLLEKKACYISALRYSVTRHDRVRKLSRSQRVFFYPGTFFSKVLAPTVQTLENAIHEINHYPAAGACQQRSIMAFSEPDVEFFYKLNSRSLVHLMKSSTLGLGLTGTAGYLGLLCTKGAGVGRRVYYS